MIIFSVVVKAYIVMTFLTVTDEMWNMNNPRPYPSQNYYFMEWEEEDFVKLNNGSYKLRPKRKVDSKLKKYARNKHYVQPTY